MGVHLLVGIHPTEQQGRSPTGLPGLLAPLRPKLEKYTTLRWNILGNSLPLCTSQHSFASAPALLIRGMSLEPLEAGGSVAHQEFQVLLSIFLFPSCHAG